MTFKNFAFIFAMAVILLQGGCSYTNRGAKFVALTVKPADAYVIVNGVEYHHVSPQFIEVHPNRELMMTIYKPGYKERLYVVGNQLSTVGKIDAWGSILIFPFFGLFSNGAWELKEKNILINLDPLEEPEELSVEQKQTIDAKRRADVAFREKAVESGIPPSAEEDKKNLAEVKPKQIEDQDIEIETAPRENVIHVNPEVPQSESSAAPAAPAVTPVQTQSVAVPAAKEEAVPAAEPEAELAPEDTAPANEAKDSAEDTAPAVVEPEKKMTPIQQGNVPPSIPIPVTQETRENTVKADASAAVATSPKTDVAETGTDK